MGIGKILIGLAVWLLAGALLQLSRLPPLPPPATDDHLDNVTLLLVKNQKVCRGAVLKPQAGLQRIANERKKNIVELTESERAEGLDYQWHMENMNGRPPDQFEKEALALIRFAEFGTADSPNEKDRFSLELDAKKESETRTRNSAIESRELNQKLYGVLAGVALLIMLLGIGRVVKANASKPEGGNGPA
jgi:hypothetical protein